MALIYDNNTYIATSINDVSNDFPEVLLGVKTAVSGNKAVLIKTTGFFSKLGASSNQKVVNCMDWKDIYTQFIQNSPQIDAKGIQGYESTVQGATGALQYSTSSGLKNIVDTNSAKLAIKTILATQGIEYDFDTNTFNYPGGTIIVEPALHSHTGFFEI